MAESAVLERLEITVAEENFLLAEALVGTHVPSGWQEDSLPTGETKFTIHTEEAQPLDALLDDIFAMIPEASCVRGVTPKQDWMGNWKNFFTPVDAGDFLVLPPWLAEKSENTKSDKIKLVIEPKSAFGTGHHATTTLCLTAISMLHKEGRIKAGQDFLDLGTGTGILGMGCVKLGMHGLGLDIDSLAVSNALENAALNDIQTQEVDAGTESAACVKSAQNGTSNFEIGLGSVDAAGGKQFDLVIANILAGPLREMAEPIMASVRSGGCLILSGFLTVQLPDLKKAYAPLGEPRQLGQEADMKDGEWICLFWDNCHI